MAATALLRTLRLNSTRTFPRATIRIYSSEQQSPQYQAPASPQAPPNPHRQFYSRSGAGRAIAFNFLIAMATFQVLYWGWLKLESIEVKQTKLGEIERLENEVKELKAKGKA